MNSRIEQLNITLELIQKNNLKAFPIHTVIEPDQICSCRSVECNAQGKHPINKWKEGPFFNKMEEFVIRSGDKNLLSNIGIKTGEGIVVIDFDSVEAYSFFIKKYPHLEKTLTVRTGKGFHAYFKSKQVIGNKVKIIKDTDIRGEGGYVVAPGSNHISGSEYCWLNPDSTIMEFPYSFIDFSENKKNKDSDELRTQISEGGRNNYLYRETCNLFELGISFPVLKELINLLNQNVCNPPLDSFEVDQIIGSGQSKYINKMMAPNFPESSMFGILGKLVKKIAPHTEASPVAIYSQLITLMGCYLGRVASTQVSGDRHYPNCMTLIVGDSATARKGTSLGVATWIVKQVLPDFVTNNIKSGATSAEGIIFHNRDPIYEIKDKKGKLENVCVDAGVKDKRLMIVETEFGSVLISMKREGNKLSTTLRDAYDSKNLSTLSKVNSVRSTDPHISLVAHITIEELAHLLATVDIFNGFGNRFLIIHAKSEKILPEAPSLEDLELRDEIEELRSIVFFMDDYLNIYSEKRALFSEEAQNLWNQRYTEYMQNPKAGVVGTLLNRNLIHVKKIALILTMLDKKFVIEKVHLEAAFALGDYSKSSVEFIFRDKVCALSNKHKKVLNHLESCLTNSASRSEISKDALKKNVSSTEIDQIKNDLVEQDLIAVVKNPSNEVWELK